MRSKLIYGLVFILPLITYTACSDDDDVPGSGGTGGRAGASSGGRAGANSGGRSGSAGEDSSDAGASTSGGTGGRAGGGGRSGGGGTTGGGGPSEGGAGGVGGDSDGVAGEGGAGGEAAVLSDAHIVKVLATANQGEVAAAHVAQPAAQTVAVKNYATLMITEHSAANAQTLALVSTKHIAPVPSPISEQLEAKAAALLVTLSQTPQASFDQVYIQSQIAMHQEVLTLIDTRLLPDATDADLQALIATIRVSVIMHLDSAKTIFAAL